MNSAAVAIDNRPTVGVKLSVGSWSDSRPHASDAVIERQRYNNRRGASDLRTADTIDSGGASPFLKRSHARDVSERMEAVLVFQICTIPHNPKKWDRPAIRHLGGLAIAMAHGVTDELLRRVRRHLE